MGITIKDDKKAGAKNRTVLILTPVNLIKAYNRYAGAYSDVKG